MNKKDFPLLKTHTFLDSSAGGLKPIQVVEKINKFYLECPINPHSRDSLLGQKLEKTINETREEVASLIDCKKNEVIFTSGTTDSINKFAFSFLNLLKEGDEILVSSFNHSSNVLPWLEIAKIKNAKVIFTDNIINDINEKTKIVTFSEIENSLRLKKDIKKIYEKSKMYNAIVFNDAAQSIVEKKVNLKYSDVIVFSGNKIFAPTGIGVLAIKEDLKNKLTPIFLGGGTIHEIKNDGSYTIKKGVPSFEPGTPNTAGIFGLLEAIKYFKKNADFDYLKKLSKYAFKQISKIEDVKIYSNEGEKAILFNVSFFNSQDVVSYLGHKNILIRSGDHCAKNIKNIKKDFNSTIRVSLSFYNDEKDIDLLIKEINNGIKGGFVDFL